MIDRVDGVHHIDRKCDHLSRLQFASILPDTPPARQKEATLRVARVRHTESREHPHDWDAAAMCWQVFAPYAEHVTGCKFEEVSPRRLGKDDLAGVRLLHLTATRPSRGIWPVAIAPYLKK